MEPMENHGDHQPRGQPHNGNQRRARKRKHLTRLPDRISVEPVRQEVARNHLAKPGRCRMEHGKACNEQPSDKD
ncbi:MAG: hypothetical protein COV99_11345 [Bacteroidetes bacterium CG12_big_fil_rev_8_21_14_0_65_60_17]|nr:MAG: hypothetical protein COV99_11345 [Bacteroidetes bacterium CG12_big_fil_rev_8_21_14_0_65_60_17]